MTGLLILSRSDAVEPDRDKEAAVEEAQRLLDQRMVAPAGRHGEWVRETRERGIPCPHCWIARRTTEDMARHLATFHGGGE